MAFALFFAFAFAFTAPAPILQPIQKATQTQTDNGTIGPYYVSPETLALFTGIGNTNGITSQQGTNIFFALVAGGGATNLPITTYWNGPHPSATFGTILGVFTNNSLLEAPMFWTNGTIYAYYPISAPTNNSLQISSPLNMSGKAITNTVLNASDLGAGTLPNGRFPAVLPAVDGSQLTGITGAGNAQTNIPVSAVTNAGTAAYSNASAFMLSLPVPLRGNLLLEYRFDELAGPIAHNTAFPHENGYDNLYALPEQSFNENSAVWSGDPIPSRTTENYDFDPWGNSKSATRMWIPDGGGWLSHNCTLAAQTYTMSAWVKSLQSNFSNTFRFWGSGVPSSTFTAVTQWQRFSYTFTGGGGNTHLPVASDSSNNGFDLAVWGFKLEPGSLATEYKNPSWHMALGARPGVDAKDPAWTTNALSLEGSVAGFAVGRERLNFSQVSMYALARKTTAPVFAHLFPVLNTPDGVLLALNAADGKDNSSSIIFNNATLRAYSGANWWDGRWHVMAGTYDGTNVLALYFDEALIGTNHVGVVSPIQATNLFLGDYLNTAYFPGEIAYLSAYSGWHSQNQVRSNTAYIRGLARQRGIVSTNNANFIIWEGDSISDPAATVQADLIYVWGVMTNTTLPGRNFAVQGTGYQEATNHAPQVDAMFDARRSKNIISILYGANDISSDGSGVELFTNRLTAWSLARKAVGFKIVMSTVLPRYVGNADFEASRLVANTYIRNNVNIWDGLADNGADTVMGNAANLGDTTYYSDGSHPTATGHTYLKTNFLNAVNTVLAQ